MGIVRVFERNNASLKKEGISFHWWDAGATSLHDHDFYEVFIVTSGESRHILNGMENRVGEGMLFLIRPEDKHQFLPLEEKRCIHINIPFTSETFSSLSASLGMKAEEIREGRRNLLLTGEDFSWFLNRAGEINFFLENNKDMVPIITREMLLRSFVLLYKESGDTLSSLPSWVRALCLTLHSPEHIACTAKEVYELSGYSAPIVTQAFRKYLGKSVNGYMKDIKMDWARRLLETTELSVLEISLRLGYSSLSHFSKIFKEENGVTCSEYKKRRALFKTDQIRVRE